MRSAGKSRALIGHVHHPLRTYYRGLVETKALPSSPAADLRYFVGKRKAKGKAAYPYFTQEEGPVLLVAAAAVFPRWHPPFVMTVLLVRRRWGECATLQKADVDFKRGYLHVQRTLSRDRTVQAPKDSDGRRVKMSPALAKTLKTHIEAMTLEGQVNATCSRRSTNTRSWRWTRSSPSSPRRWPRR